MAKILIAEDSLTLRTLLEQFLSDAGYDVISAKNGIDAYKLFLNTLPDLVLTDNQMPGMTGMEFSLRLRDEGFVTPVILISGDRIYYQGYLEELIVLQKPFSYRKLLFIIDAYVY